MPSEYEALVAALKLTSIPFMEYGWKTRPFDEFYMKTVALGVPISWDEML